MQAAMGNVDGGCCCRCVEFDAFDRIVDVVVQHRAAFVALCVLSPQQLHIALCQLLLLLRHKNGQVLEHGNGLRLLGSVIDGRRTRIPQSPLIRRPGSGRRERRQHRAAQQWPPPTFAALCYVMSETQEYE